jgi:hypothetical protein
MTIGAVGTSTDSRVSLAAIAGSSTDGATFAAMLADARDEAIAPGRLDFCRISPRAMQQAAKDLVASGRVGAAGLAEAVALTDASDAPDTPINMIAYLRHEASQNEKTPGAMTLAFRQKAALAALIHVQREEGAAVVYDRDFPTAPRDLTAEEINAKLKQAIDAFRKEAELTPAQRLAKKLRAEVMKDMKVSEDDLKAMPQADRALLEQKIGDEVARRLALLGCAAVEGKGTADGHEATAGSGTVAAAS